MEAAPGAPGAPKAPEAPAAQGAAEGPNRGLLAEASDRLWPLCELEGAGELRQLRQRHQARSSCDSTLSALSAPRRALSPDAKRKMLPWVLEANSAGEQVGRRGNAFAPQQKTYAEGSEKGSQQGSGDPNKRFAASGLQ